MSVDKPRRLGRGLEALISTAAAPTAPTDRPEPQHLPVASIRPNPYQPRKEFRPDELAELEVSLRTNGLLQPVVVRPAGDGGYELIAGERRLRAATRLGWTDIPVVVRDIDDRTLLTLALVENLQRADLNPVEEAEGYQRLVAEFGMSQQQIADLIGKDRSTIANLLRILQLPAGVKGMLQRGELSLGHARALLAIGDQRLMLETARQIVERGLTVRDVERRAQERRVDRPAETRSPADRHDPQVRLLEEQLRKALQTDVSLTVSRDHRGTIAIRFYSSEDLERILDVILPNHRGQ